MLRKKNKKGFTQDFLFLGVFIFVFAVIIIVGSLLQTYVNNKWLDQDVSATSKTIMNNNTNKYYEFSDYIFFTVFILFVLTLLSGVFLLNTHPFLYWIAVVILGFSLIPIAILSNTFNKFGTNGTIATELSRYTLIDGIFSNGLLVFAIIGIMVVVLLLSKNR